MKQRYFIPHTELSIRFTDEMTLAKSRRVVEVKINSDVCSYDEMSLIYNISELLTDAYISYSAARYRASYFFTFAASEELSKLSNFKETGLKKKADYKHLNRRIKELFAGLAEEFIKSPRGNDPVLKKEFETLVKPNKTRSSCLYVDLENPNHVFLSESVYKKLVERILPDICLDFGNFFDLDIEKKDLVELKFVYSSEDFQKMIVELRKLKHE